MLNVYRALEVTFGRKGKEAQDAKIHLKKILEKTICNGKFRIATNLLAEIEHELGLPWLTRMDHLEHRECIERGNVNDIWTGKAWYRLLCVNDAKLLSLAKENFTYRQSIYKRELKELEGWARDNGIFDLGFGRNKTSYCYFAMAATIYHPRSHILRTTSAKNGILFTIIDDFFDTEGSMNELTTFTDAVERWDGEVLHGHGKVLFDAMNDLVNDTAMQAFPIQGRNVTKHLQDIWCEIIRSWLKEAEWSRRNYTPTIDEYLKVATISVAVQTAVVPTVYLVGPTISEELVNHPDYTKITELLMISTRLLKDLQSYQKEREEGKQNLILLLMQGHSDRMLEHACAYATDVLDQTKEELLEHALMNDKNSIPKSCRKLHFVLLKIFHMFYNSTNVYDSPTELIHSINRAIHVPL